MKQEYTHLPLGEEVRGLSGFYVPSKEARLKYDGKEVLYVIGMSTADSACCGGGSFGYALVPGYLLSWKKRKNKAGLPVSEVEPIADAAVRREVARIIKDTESIRNIDFW